MQRRKIGELSLTPYNPRKPWTETQKERFARSLREFGDLSGVVYNTRTQRLVGGNKRCERFAEDGGIVVIEKRLDSPDPTGTIAYGHVVVDGTRFAYREVDWPEEKEKAANLAANRWHAEWDEDQLSELLREIEGTPLIELTGFDDAELMHLSQPDVFDTRTLPDNLAGYQHEDVSAAYIIYLTFQQREDFVRAVHLLTAGAHRPLPANARFVRITGEDPTGKDGAVNVIQLLEKLSH